MAIDLTSINVNIVIDILLTKSGRTNDEQIVTSFITDGRISTSMVW